ncbi:MAG: hypothetical protein V3U02_06890 [Calditrichia bacterium]
MNDTLYNAAIEFIGGEKNPYPRDIAHWRPATTFYHKGKEKVMKLKPGFQRKVPPVENEDQYIAEVSENADIGVAGALLGFPMKTDRMRTRLFLEIGDNLPIHLAHGQMQEFDRTLTTLYNAVPAWLYSANKSFWVHIPFRALKIKTTRYYLMRECIKHIVQCGRDIGLVSGDPDIDWGLLDDWGRLARLPYTTHFGTVLYNAPGMVVPINPKWSLHQIMQESKDCQYREDFVMHEGENYAIRELVKQTDCALYNLEQSGVNIIQSAKGALNVRPGKFKKEIDHIIQCAPRLGENWSRVIYHLLVPYLRWSNYTEQEGADVVKTCVNRAGEDFADWEYQFEYDWNRDAEGGKAYAPMKLENFMERYPELRRCLS